MPKDFPDHIEDTIDSLSKKELKKRLISATNVLVQYGQIDGAHHKQWCIDQAIRRAMGCPQIKVKAKDCNGEPYSYKKLGESKDYDNLVRYYCNVDKDGNPFDPSEHWSWDIGIAP